MKVKKVNRADKKLITLNVPVKILNAYTDLADQLCVTRNNLMIMGLNEYLAQHEALRQLPSLLEELKKQKDEK